MMKLLGGLLVSERLTMTSTCQETIQVYAVKFLCRSDMLTKTELTDDRST